MQDGYLISTLYGQTLSAWILMCTHTHTHTHIINVYYTCVNTTIPKRHCLLRACSSHTTAAAVTLHDVDESLLVGPGPEPDAGLVVVLLHSLGYHTALVLGEHAGDDVGDGGTGPLPPTITDSIPRLPLPHLPQIIHGHIVNIPLKKLSKLYRILLKGIK